MKRSLLKPVLFCAMVAAWGFPGLAMVQETSVLEPSLLVEGDWKALVGPYPLPGSGGTERDLAVLLYLQQSRTLEDIGRAQAGIRIAMTSFADLLDREADPGHFPLTLAVLDRANSDLRGVLDPLKWHYLRPRPFSSHAELVPAIEKEASHSYPSGHATRGVLYAAILAEFQPGQQALLLARGHRLGNDRAVGGVHWPSDVHAGQQLGTAFAKAWLAMPDHRHLVKTAAEAEWDARPSLIP
jgi:hypothetical protein